MTPELLKRIKSYVRLIIATLIISAVLVYVTCYVNQCSLLQVFTLQETTVITCIAIAANVIVIGTCIYILVMNTLPLPEIPGGPWAREQLIVCRYSEGPFCTIAVVCICIGIGMLVAACVYLSSIGENMETIVWAFLYAVMGPVFLILGGVFALFVKNYMIIFYPEGVYYQNAFGKPYVATNEQIEYVSVLPMYRDESFRLRTIDRDLHLNRYCSEYFKAQKYVQKRFMDFDTYLKQQEAEKRI